MERTLVLSDFSAFAHANCLLSASSSVAWWRGEGEVRKGVNKQRGPERMAERHLPIWTDLCLHLVCPESLCQFGLFRRLGVGGLWHLWQEGWQPVHYGGLVEW